MPDAIPKDSSYMLTGVSIENIDISINKLEYLPKIIHIKFDEFPIYLSYKPEIDIKKSLLILNIIPEEEKFVQN
jgi:hypothetical protein